MQIGISTFGEVAPAHVAGQDHAAAQRMQELLAMGRQADKAGLDVFALGEHHRPDFVVSAPEVILAAVAAQTKRIHLSSAVTVLSSADPVRTYQNFATLDLISNGRAEIIAGRGSFTESFALFGQDVKHYDAIFLENLQLLLNINQNEVVTWQGKHRAAIAAKGVYPRPTQAHLPVWLGVGGTPASFIRAGQLDLPLTIAILGSPPRSTCRLWSSIARRPGKPATTWPPSKSPSTATYTYPTPPSRPAMSSSRPTRSS